MSEDTDGDAVAIPEQVALVIGDRWSIRLPGLASAGYDWTVAVVARQPKDRSVISAGLTVLDDPSRADRGDATSYSSPVEATIVAVEPGRAVVRLTLARGWQRRPPLRRHDIEVTVTQA